MRRRFYDRYKQGIIVGIFSVVGTALIFQSAASPELPADINSDGIVNMQDLSILFTNWGRTGPTTPGTPPTPPGTPSQTLGVGGVATPADAIRTTADSTSELVITSGGTADKPKVYDGGGHTVGTIKIRASWVVVQNFRIKATGQYGVDSRVPHVTIQNNDIKGVRPSGDGDLNAITFAGDDHKILYNTAINFVDVSDAGGSHTDAIQTWNDDTGESSSNVLIRGNRFEGPPSEGPATHIHQGVICEGKDSTDGGGGGTGESRNWLIDGNYFSADLKFDDCDDVHVTRNTFAGNDKRAVVVTSLSTGFRYYSDNTVTGTLSVGIGAPITPGPGPSTLPGL